MGRHIVTILPVSLFVAVFAACGNDAIEANKRAVQQNQAAIEQTQQQLAMLQAQQAGGITPPSAIPGKPGGCDKSVEATATHRAGDAYASGDMTKALGYYQDALTACPSSSKAAVNLARVYETLDNREAAIKYYRAAANGSDADAGSIQNARTALTRLGAQ